MSIIVEVRSKLFTMAFKGSQHCHCCGYLFLDLNHFLEALQENCDVGKVVFKTSFLQYRLWDSQPCQMYPNCPRMSTPDQWIHSLQSFVTTRTQQVFPYPQDASLVTNHVNLSCVPRNWRTLYTTLIVELAFSERKMAANSSQNTPAGGEMAEE